MGLCEIRTARSIESFRVGVDLIRFKLIYAKIDKPVTPTPPLSCLGLVARFDMIKFVGLTVSGQLIDRSIDRSLMGKRREFGEVSNGFMGVRLAIGLLNRIYTYADTNTQMYLSILSVICEYHLRYFKYMAN